MRTTVTIEDALFEQAMELAPPGTNKAGLFREAVKTFVRVHSAQRIAALGGTAPDIEDVPRLREHRQVPHFCLLPPGIP